MPPSVTFHNYQGTQQKSDDFHYSQAVKVGNIVKTSGQGGWTESGSMPEDPAKQVELAFANVALALRSVEPSLGWNNVFAVRTYHTSIDETVDFVIEKFKEVMPGHRPVFTCVEIGKLGIPGMKVEMEVEAIIKE